MKLTCAKEDLLFGVQAVNKGISGKNTLPVLNGIYMEAYQGTLLLKATDLDLAVQCCINSDVQEEGVVVVADGRRLLDMVRQLPSGDIYMETINDYDLKLHYGNSSLLLRGLDCEEFPLLPQQDGEVFGELSAESFCRLVRQTSPAAGTDEARPIFTGIYLEITEESVIMVANDTHRLALARDHFVGSGNYSVIVPAKTMQEVARAAAGCEKVNLKITKNHISFETGNLLIISRVIKGQYPDYHPVIPKEESYTSRMLVNRQNLYEMVARGVSIARDANGTIRLHLEDDLLKMSAHSPEIGEIKKVAVQKREKI